MFPPKTALPRMSIICTYRWQSFLLQRDIKVKTKQSHSVFHSLYITNSVAPEPEGSPLYLKVRHGPYLEPTGSTLHPQPFWSYAPICASFFSFLQAFTPKPCTIFSTLPCVPHALPTSFSLIWSAWSIDKSIYLDQSKYWLFLPINRYIPTNL
jgi:hypothetical protein